MLTLWRRHKSKCEHKDDRYWRKCRCAMWREGTVDGRYERHSLKAVAQRGRLPFRSLVGPLLRLRIQAHARRTLRVRRRIVSSPRSRRRRTLSYGLGGWHVWSLKSARWLSYLAFTIRQRALKSEYNFRPLF